MEMTDMRMLLTSDAQLQQAIERLQEFQTTGRLPVGLTDDNMWRARQVKEAIIHPVSGEKMFLPGRMSAFVPSNTIPTAGMLMAKTPVAMLFAHWLNQTVNVVVNYTNRSGAEVNTAQLAQAYGLAVGSSCCIAVGASALIKRGPPVVKRLGLAVPYVAVVAAGAGNVAFTRWPEVSNGVPVASADGRTLGLSQAAALESIKLTVLSRNVALPVIPLLIPPLTMSFLRRRVPAIAAGGALAVLTELGVVSGCLGVGLPLAIAIFPQEMRIRTAALEPQCAGRFHLGIAAF
jgi:tricarboxylate carrier